MRNLDRFSGNLFEILISSTVTVNIGHRLEVGLEVGHRECWRQCPHHAPAVIGRTKLEEPNVNL